MPARPILGRAGTFGAECTALDPPEHHHRSSAQDGKHLDLTSAGRKLDEAHRRRHLGQQPHRVLQTGGRHTKGALQVQQVDVASRIPMLIASLRGSMARPK